MTAHKVDFEDPFGFAKELTMIISQLALELELAERGGDESHWTRIQAQAQLAERHCREFLEVIQPTPGVRLNVAQSIAEVHPKIDRLIPKHIHLHILRIDPGLFVMTGQTVIPRMICNLVENSVEVLGQQAGSIVVQATLTKISENRALPPGQYVALSVTDSGPGLDEDGAARLFQLSGSPGQTTRIGLACLLQISKRWGGCMRVASEKGLGTRIECLLPSHG